MLKLSNYSLTAKMLFLTVAVGLVIWTISDALQTSTLKRIFQSKLADRFSRQAEKQRIMFDRYVKGHHQTVMLLIKNYGLIKYVKKSAWRKNQQIRFYNEPPPWLPRLAVIRNFFQPRYMLLLDKIGRVKEVYRARAAPLPKILVHPSRMLLSLTHNQGFLTTLGNEPYLLASAKIVNDAGNTLAILMLASPLDEEFLIASQGSALADTNIIALLAEDQPAILVSSNSTLVPPGTKIDTLKDHYLTTGQGFFDYGATDIII